MPASSPEPDKPDQALEIKSGSITLPIIKLLSADLARVNQQLATRIRRAPDLFRNAPVVLDLGEMGPARDNLDIPQWAEALRQHGLVPVGIRGGSPAQELAANAAKLAVLAEGKTETTQRSAAPSATTKSVAADKPKATLGETKLIQQPVRSGQRIYAAGGDLIVLAPVSHGAEIMADGNIHVYGSLKGRALAGVKGNLSARIFCSDLQAELVAIGGSYKISENLDASLQGRPVQIYLKDEALIVDAL